VPKLETQIEFSVGIFSHERVKHLNFTVRRSGAILPRKKVAPVSRVPRRTQEHKNSDKPTGRRAARPALHLTLHRPGGRKLAEPVLQQ